MQKYLWWVFQVIFSSLRRDLRADMGSYEVILLPEQCCYSYSSVVTWLYTAVVQLFNTLHISTAAVIGWADSKGSLLSVPYKARSGECVEGPFARYSTVPSEEGGVKQAEGRQSTWWWVFHGRMWRILVVLESWNGSVEALLCCHSHQAVF